ncbi:MAG: VanW family protein [Dermatophilaceae bacterium]
MSHEFFDDYLSWDSAVTAPWYERRSAIGGLAAVGVLLVLVGSYLAAAQWSGERIPRGTTIADVEVGGLSASAARDLLGSRFADRTTRPLVLTSPAGKVTTTATDLGIEFDVDATVANLTGFTVSPVAIWRQLVGGGAEPAVLTVRQEKFATALEAARGTLDVEPAEGSVSVASGTVTYATPTAGVRTDISATADSLRRLWPGVTTVAVAVDRRAPKVAAAEFQRVRADFADIAVSGPISVTANGTTFPLTPKQFGPAVVLTPGEDGSITPRADPAKLAAVVRTAATEAKATVAPEDAEVTFSGRTPTVTPHVRGIGLDEKSLQAEVWRAIGSTTRTATLATTVVEPKFTTAIAKATLPRERISTFTTNFTAGQPRVQNIALAARLINGTYIPPGAQFSMNAILGERTPEKGYVKAGIIRNGRAAENYGGGISQVSTTIFNAAFFSGMRLDEWTPHFYYISRYPEGREATISWPDLHNKFTNVTDGGVLMEVSTTKTSVTVSFYGTKKWDIEATKSARRDVIAPKKYDDPDPECVAQSPVSGFTVDVGRIFRQGGSVVKRESYTTSYDPEDDVTCTNPVAAP